jgi:hypothetical protein
MKIIRRNYLFLGLMLKISWKSDKEWLQGNVLKISGLIQVQYQWYLTYETSGSPLRFMLRRSSLIECVSVLHGNQCDFVRNDNSNKGTTARLNETRFDPKKKLSPIYLGPKNLHTFWCTGWAWNCQIIFR